MKKIIITLFSVSIALLAMSPSVMAKVKKTSSPQVIYTGEIAKKVIGYNGTTPVNITISNGKITSIEALDNKETPAYFNKAKEKVFKQFIGKSLKEALNLDADVATGATYTSEALIKNIKMGLEQSKNNQIKDPSKKTGKNSGKSKGKKRMTR